MKAGLGFIDKKKMPFELYGKSYEGMAYLMNHGEIAPPSRQYYNTIYEVKFERILKHYSSFNEAKIRIFDYINGFYNRNRIHSAINYLSPVQFEKSLLHS